MQKLISTFIDCSRIFTLPMTFFSWLVIFLYSISDSGNPFYGLIALIGVCFAHLGTNVLDDYIDYKLLIKQVGYDKDEYLKNTQKTKCRYIINGSLKESKVLAIATTFFIIAICCGIFLFFTSGIGVFYYTLIGAIIALTYSIGSRFCLSEIAVGLAYGPTLFGGVYYVMTGTYSEEVFLLAIPTMLITIVLLYIHTVMDYNYDINEGKCTIANRFNSPLESLIVLKYLLILAYLSVIFLCIFDILDWQVFFVYLTIPMAIDLYKSMKDFSINPEMIPNKRWYHFPMENLEKINANSETSFMIRMYQSRNLLIYFSLFIVLAIFSDLIF